MFTSIIIASINPFTGSDENPATADKNGEMPVILQVVAGKCPNKRVISGTVAKRAGLEVGNSYVISCTEGTPDEEYGRNFNWNRLTDALGPMDLIKGCAELGDAKLFNVTDSLAHVEEEAIALAETEA